MSEKQDKTFKVDKMKTNVRRMGYLFVFLFGDPSWNSLVIGSGLILVAVLLHGWAAGYLARAGYSSRETKLTVRGPYRHNRNPYYLAHLIMDFGFFLVAGLPLWYLCYFALIFAVYQKWALNEEEFLEKEFGDNYRKMKSQVSRWGFRLFPAESQGHEENFTWSDYMYNNELKRTLSHLFLLGLFWDFYYLSNPFLNLSFYARFTLVGFVGTWILLRDVKPAKDGISRPGSLILGMGPLILSMTTTMYWNFTPVFEGWIRLTGFISGIVILAVLLAGFIPTVKNTFEYFYQSTFKHPLLSVLYIFLGGALLTGSSMVLWTGLLLSLAIWCFQFSGLDTERYRNVLTPVS